jgi:hypothetical protein
MVFKNDVADDMAPVGHSVWPRWAPRLARRHPVWHPVGHWPPVWPPSARRAPLLAPVGPPVRHPVWPPSGTLSGPRRAPCPAPVGSKKNLFFIFLVVVAGWKRGEKIFRFSVFNPQDPLVPQDPRDPRVLQVPRALRASRAKPQEEEGFFGLVLLVTHRSSIPLLGGLTPKFLSLSFHSL